MGMQAKTITFSVSPMAPSSTVPITPARARAGEAGAVVPTPAGCHPAVNWESVAHQPGKGTNWPTTGSPPPSTPLEPTTTTSVATSQVVSLVLPLSRPRLDPAASASAAHSSAAARSTSADPSANSAAASSSACAPWKPATKTRRP